MEKTRVLVCGGRDYSDKDYVFRMLDQMEQIEGEVEIIQGMARGADSLAGEWAEARGRVQHKFPADWKTHGKAAGYIRNKQMLEEGRPQLVIGFPGGTGTKMMLDIAEKAGVMVVSLPGNNND